MHVLLQDPSPDSLEWGQHMAQLSALVHSRSCPGGLDHVPVIAASKYHEFIKWVQLSRKGKWDYHALQCLQEDYKQHGTNPCKEYYQPPSNPACTIDNTEEDESDILCLFAWRRLSISATEAALRR